jgi:large subunit ribosomal protein L25
VNREETQVSKVVFKAASRVDSGSSFARRLRRSGRIPAVIYGRKGNPLSIDLDSKEFMTNIRGISESTIVGVDVEGTVHEAFVKSTQRNIRDGNILHVDFYEIESNTLVRARVSLHIHGNPIGVREGGVLETPLHDIEVECLPKDLPERLDVDIAALNVNQSIHVRDLALGDGVKLISNSEQVVALVKFAKAEATPAVEEVEAAAEGAAVPAAGAAPAPGAAAPAAEKKA